MHLFPAGAYLQFLTGFARSLGRVAGTTLQHGLVVTDFLLVLS